MRVTTNFSILGLLALVSSTAAKMTTVGLETADDSHAVVVPLTDCHDIGQDEVHTMHLTKKCRVFTGQMCTGTTVLLQPGTHTSKQEPVHVGSVICEEPDLF
ncbi:hypothetical protein ASPSYDRAFT_40732 [Aspergillus sydowii CBS 593.65]|uniref:Uncharacterized protein n=1 Tax=Aspergillus sydowii CBS 593.65 TaxID=1036612 RepID=A0A1L9TRR4_9EURO|nr:uncharacterized protein ASPSYDRAFT_40732 [Aspergillus sydowii CBS 593.65]OJJ62124.1 hypothetical protein ASPSYDRAFT_40732 [Aspergillus sydowii CBS 593.65]